MSPKVKGYAVGEDTKNNIRWIVAAVYDLGNICGEYDTIKICRKKKEAMCLAEKLKKLDNVMLTSIPEDLWHHRSEGNAVHGFFYKYTHSELKDIL